MKNRLKKLMDYIPLIDNYTKLKISGYLLAIAILMSIANIDSLACHLCTLAMFMSFIGDICLNCMPLNRRPHSLLYTGAVFFMLAHITYAYAYYTLIKATNKPYFNTGAIIAIVFLILLVSTIIFTIIKSKQKLKASMLLVFGIYVIMISINFITVCSYSFSFIAISFIGALSFLISDLIIGIETVFKIKSDILRKLVWIFYPIGQIILLIGR